MLDRQQHENAVFLTILQCR